MILLAGTGSGIFDGKALWSYCLRTHASPHLLLYSSRRIAPCFAEDGIKMSLRWSDMPMEDRARKSLSRGATTELYGLVSSVLPPISCIEELARWMAPCLRACRLISLAPVPRHHRA